MPPYPAMITRLAGNQLSFRHSLRVAVPSPRGETFLLGERVRLYVMLVLQRSTVTFLARMLLVPRYDTKMYTNDSSIWPYHVTN